MLNSKGFLGRSFLVFILAALFPFSFLEAASNVWTQALNMTQDRAGSAAALLSGGRVLFTGGADASGTLNTTEFSTQTDRFRQALRYNKRDRTTRQSCCRTDVYWSRAVRLWMDPLQIRLRSTIL